MMAIISSVGLDSSGSSSDTTWPGMLATVMSHALTAAAATSSITTAVVRAAATNTP